MARWILLSISLVVSVISLVVLLPYAGGGNRAFTGYAHPEFALTFPPAWEVRTFDLPAGIIFTARDRTGPVPSIDVVRLSRNTDLLGSIDDRGESVVARLLHNSAVTSKVVSRPVTLPAGRAIEITFRQTEKDATGRAVEASVVCYVLAQADITWILTLLAPPDSAERYDQNFYYIAQRFQLR